MTAYIDIELVDIDNESNIDTILEESTENSDISEYEDISSQEQEVQKELFRQKVEFFNKNLITIFMEGDDLFSAVVDKLVSLYSQSKESIDANIPKGVDAIKYMVAKKVTQILLGDGFEIRQIDARQDNLKQEIDQHSTEAALQRVDELKQKYTPEQIMEMRKLRAEVEEILSKIIAIDKDKSEKLTDANRQKLKQQVLQSYGIPKYRGKKLDFDPIDFIKRTDTYGKFIEAGVIFKADIRKMDKELVAILNQEISRNHKTDPLMTEEQFTEMKAAGIFGYEKQGVARGNIATRKINRDRMRLFTEASSIK